MTEKMIPLSVVDALIQTLKKEEYDWKVKEGVHERFERKAQIEVLEEIKKEAIPIPEQQKREPKKVCIVFQDDEVFRCFSEPKEAIALTLELEKRRKEELERKKQAKNISSFQFECVNYLLRNNEYDWKEFDIY